MPDLSKVEPVSPAPPQVARQDPPPPPVPVLPEPILQTAAKNAPDVLPALSPVARGNPPVRAPSSASVSAAEAATKPAESPRPAAAPVTVAFEAVRKPGGTGSGVRGTGSGGGGGASGSGAGGRGGGSGAGSGTGAFTSEGDSDGYGVFVPARTVGEVKVLYPQASRRLGEEGTVVLEVEVLADGTLGCIEIKKRSGSARLDEAAIESVKKARFMPAKRGNRPVASVKKLAITFRLEDADS